LPAKEREKTRKSKMEIGQKFNKLTLKEYFFCIENHKKYTEFNTLGLYRSILENEKLDLVEKVEVRDYANQFFQKTFDFLQLKDPFTFFGLSTLGKELTVADERKGWNEIRENQERILKAKRIKHRNFGVYSRHTCVETCLWNGLMVRQGSNISRMNPAMRFNSDKINQCAELKSLRNKKERKKEKQTVQKLIEEDFFEAGRTYEFCSQIEAYEAAAQLRKLLEDRNAKL
jgi:hypothetical protein